MNPSFPSEYSAPVSLRLHVKGEVLELAKVGPERMVLKHARALSAGEAQLVITIGAMTTHQEIVIDANPSSSTTEVKYW